MRRQRGRNRIGGYPAALSLDFLNAPQSAASALTFTRASTGTYFDAAGVMQTAGSNVPRFDFDPATLQPRGLLIEEQRTNLLLNSATLSTQSVAVTAQAYTLSFYGSGSVTLSGAATGTLSSAGAYSARATLTFAPSAGTLTLTVAGSVQYANLEAGSFTTSWIPSTGAAATRSADICTMPLASVAGWNGSEGTIFADFDASALRVSGDQNVAYVDDGTLGNRVGIRVDTGSVQSLALNGGSGAVLSHGSATANVPYRLALAWASNSVASTLNGGTPQTSPTYAVPAMTTIRLGANSGGSQLNGHIRRLRLYGRRQPDAVLQGMTA